MHMSRPGYGNLPILPLLTLIWACGPLDAGEGRSPEAGTAGEPVELREFVEVPAGTSLEIQLDETLSTRSTRVGSPISGSVTAASGRAGNGRQSSSLSQWILKEKSTDDSSGSKSCARGGMTLRV